MSHLERSPVKAELDRLTMKFFHAMSFEFGEAPSHASIAALFIERGLLIINVGSTPEISSVQEFIAPREALVSSGMLTRFHESEILGIHRDLRQRGASIQCLCQVWHIERKAVRSPRDDLHAVCQHAWRLENACHGVGRREARSFYRQGDGAFKVKNTEAASN
ncbi:hypothetical protein [Polaromonas hydrogenivorans]|uniref:Uncharacterized protein n=1 Tax=Polaromonas hydrogenivorans TaxID=335476 RepID=A0AAU7LYT5_9BURK